MRNSTGERDQGLVTADEQWFRTLFAASPDPAWIIDEHRFVECNDAAARTLGYGSKDEFLNVHPSRLSPSHQPDGEDSFTKAERMLGIAQQSGLHRFEWVHQRRDGSHFIAEVTLADLFFRGRKVIYCVWRDITERKETEARLRLASSIMESTSEGVLVTDEHGTIIHLGERECSVQRRHQKLIEEAPSPAVTPELRKEMGEVALSAMNRIGYNNVGTIEFLMDEEVVVPVKNGVDVVGKQ